jgi:hypothetical protein
MFQKSTSVACRLRGSQEMLNVFMLINGQLPWDKMSWPPQHYPWPCKVCPPSYHHHWAACLSNQHQRLQSPRPEKEWGNYRQSVSQSACLYGLLSHTHLLIQDYYGDPVQGPRALQTPSLPDSPLWARLINSALVPREKESVYYLCRQIRPQHNVPLKPSVLPEALFCIYLNFNSVYCNDVRCSDIYFRMRLLVILYSCGCSTRN